MVIFIALTNITVLIYPCNNTSILNGYILKLNTKNLNKRIDNAVNEYELISDNGKTLNSLESLAKKIHKNYLNAIDDQKVLERNISNLNTAIEQKKALKTYYNDALIKLLVPEEFNLTLICKKQNNIHYIKGRVYWDSKQREIQIGSIPNVIKKIKNLIAKGFLNPIDSLDKINIDWIEIKQDKDILSAIQFIGKAKFKKYLTTHFKFLPSNFKGVFTSKALSKFSESTEHNTLPVDGASSTNNWYSSWRENNL